MFLSLCARSHVSHNTNNVAVVTHPVTLRERDSFCWKDISTLKFHSKRN